jgi:hypothetical protein
LRLILKIWTAPRRIKPMHISGSTVWTIGELTDGNWHDERDYLIKRLFTELFVRLSVI